MVWQPGDPWRVVRSLNRLNAQIRAAHPEAVPPATPASSWGSIADDAHSTTSDHYPHYYSALGSVAVVCARDFPHAPTLGLDAHAIAEQLRLSHDSRIGYVISNRRITGPNHSWRWDAYTGSDPHDTHIHVSSVHTAAADDTRDWQIGDDMTVQDVLDGLAQFFNAENTVQGAYLKNASNIVADFARGETTTETWFPGGVAGSESMPLQPNVRLAAIEQTLAELAARPPATVDVEALAASIVGKLPPTGLTRDDVKAAVKEALREGTGL